MAWCIFGCWRARADFCRHGAICCESIAALRRAAKFAAAASSPVFGRAIALPEAIGLLREMRRKPASEEWVSLSGADPLNLAGILTPGPRLAALTGNRIVYRDGLPVATLASGKLGFWSRWTAPAGPRRKTADPLGGARAAGFLRLK